MKKRNLALAIVVTGLLAGIDASAAEDYTRAEIEAMDLEETTVFASSESPTGYYVSFRYPATEEDRVRIYGEWLFTDIGYASIKSGMGATPDEWVDGYFAKGAGTGGNAWGSWAVSDMVCDEETGIWSYTIPLPSGIWDYRFYVGGAEGSELTDYTDAKITWDPNNVPYLADYEATDLVDDEYLSSIYVPYDAEKQANSVDYSDATPRDSENGQVRFDQIPLEDGTTASVGIYLPYGFDAERADEYPLLVLHHGGGGSESSWFNQGGAVNILDNLIAEGRLEPTVVVCPNGTDANWDFKNYVPVICEQIVPYMENTYHVSEDPSRHAFAGLSFGGATTIYAMLTYTDEFQYWCPMSGFFHNDFDVEPDFSLEALKDKTIFCGHGNFDFVCSSDVVWRGPNGDPHRLDFLQVIDELKANDLNVTTMEVDGGHDWIIWRQLFINICDNILWK